MKHSIIQRASTGPFRVATIPRQALDGLLKPGRVFSARVIGDLGENKYLISLARFNLVATSLLALKTGQTIKTTVKAISPKIHLQIEDAMAAGNEKAITIETALPKNFEDLVILFWGSSHGRSDYEARVLFHPRGKNNEKNKISRITLIHHAADIGQTEIRIVKMEESRLGITFISDNDAWLDDLKKNFAQLSAVLCAISPDFVPTLTVAPSSVVSDRVPIPEASDRLNIQI